MDKPEQFDVFNSFFKERKIDSEIDFFRNQESIVCLLNIVTVHRLLNSSDKVSIFVNNLILVCRRHS